MSEQLKYMLGEGGKGVLTDESGNLRGPSFKPLNSQESFSPDNFAKWYEDFKGLQKASVSQHGKIVFGSERALADIPAAQVEAIRAGQLQTYQGSLLGFGKTRAKELSDLVLDSTPKAIRALADYVLTSPVFEGTDPKYEETRKSFEKAKTEFETLEREPKKWVDEQLARLDPFTRALYSYNPLMAKAIEEGKARAHRRALEAVDKYGFSEFISQNVNGAWKAAEKEIREIKANVKDQDGKEREATYEEKRMDLLRARKGIEAEAAIPMTLGLTELAHQAYVAKKTAEEKAKAPKEDEESEEGSEK